MDELLYDFCFNPIIDTNRWVKKENLWNYPLSWLGGSLMTQFSVKKKYILPEMHFKAILFFSHYDPSLTHPITHPRDYRGGDTKRDEGGLMKLI